MKSIIANNVKHIINQKCFRQCAVAKRAGYNVKAFNNMLNGRRLITDVDVVNIANALEVTPGELFEIRDEEKGA